MAFELVDVESAADWLAYHAIRRDVLWTARGRTGYTEDHADEFHPAHHPLLLKCAGVAVATTRLDERGPGVGVVRLVAIPRDAQRQGHGRHLSRLVEARATRLGMTTLYVNAVSDAVDFYRKTGWEPFPWDPVELTDTFAVCIQMRKRLTGGGDRGTRSTANLAD